MIRLTAALYLMLGSTAAVAQSGNAPLVFEGGAPVPLTGSAAPDQAMAGDTYLLPFAVRNLSSTSVRLRRVAMRIPAGLEVVDPTIDGVDNDRDGIIDEVDEGFTRVDRGVAAWRIDDATSPIGSGETAERAVKVRILPTAEAGQPLTLTLLAAGSASEGTLRASQETTFSMVPPTLSISLGRANTQSFRASDTPRVSATLAIPSGRFSDLDLAVKGSPAVTSYEDARVVVGTGLMCDGSAPPVVDGPTLSARFGSCQAIADSPMDQRFVAIEAEAQFQDAEPFSDPEMIVARRTIRLAAAMTRNHETVGTPVTVSSTISGPLIGARLLSVSETPVQAGDAVRATYRLVNRGDETADDLRLFLEDDGAVDCESLQLDNGTAGRNACRAGLPLRSMEPGTLRDISLTGRLREDAALSAGVGLRPFVKPKFLNRETLPTAELTLLLPPAPDLSLDGDGEWSLDGNIVTTRIGDAGTVRISGTLPQGRYTGAVRLLSRLVDAQTGDPIGPAPLRADSFTVSPTGTAEAEVSGVMPPSTTEDGWTVVSMPLDSVTVPVTDPAAPSGYTANATVSFRDVPEMQAGRLIEIAAELSLYDASKVRSDDWIEVLIVEPSLDLTVRSPDDDRTVDLHEVAPVAVLSCNRGTAAAEAIVLTAHIPDGLLVDDVENAKVRVIAAERTNDTLSLFAPDARNDGKTYFDSAGSVLRGASVNDEGLLPGSCLALVFTLRRSDAYTPQTREGVLRAGVEPYTGRDGAQARIYAAIDTGQIRFDLPPLLFGPVSERTVGTDLIVAHTLSLEIPAAAGAHRLDLSKESSAGIDWTVLQLDETGASKPWRNGTELPAGDVLRFRLEARNPGSLPLGWVDTTLVRAVAFSQGDVPVTATTRMITRRSEAPGGRIAVTKTIALDRDCDGDVSDERIQDGLFEPVKDASPGDCVVFRVVFRHTGEKDMERIVVRDQVPAGTELIPNAIEILRAPEPLQSSEVETPGDGTRDLVWHFDGLFKPGAEGEVSYAVKLLDQPL